MAEDFLTGIIKMMASQQQAQQKSKSDMMMKMMENRMDQQSPLNKLKLLEQQLKIQKLKNEPSAFDVSQEKEVQKLLTDAASKYGASARLSPSAPPGQRLRTMRQIIAEEVRRERVRKEAEKKEPEFSKEEVLEYVKALKKEGKSNSDIVKIIIEEGYSIYDPEFQAIF